MTLYDYRVAMMRLQDSRAEIPGIKKEDIDISLSDTTLALRGEIRKESEKKDKENYYRRETR